MVGMGMGHSVYEGRCGRGRRHSSQAHLDSFHAAPSVRLLLEDNGQHYVDNASTSSKPLWLFFKLGGTKIEMKPVRTFLFVSVFPWC